MSYVWWRLVVMQIWYMMQSMSRYVDSQNITFPVGAYPRGFSPQPEPFLVTEAISSAHFSGQPETFLSIEATTTCNNMCSRRAGTWSSVAHR